MVPLDGPSKTLTVNRRLSTDDIAIFDDKAANAVVLEAENQLRSGYPTIATSSMVARRPRMSISEDVDSHMDMKFFSELVKPVKYRWKFQKAKLKTLQPSKHGFHQRSNSPTFQRLVDATEKLQQLSDVLEPDVEREVSAKTDFFETQSELNPSALFRGSSRNTKTTQTSTNASKADSLPATLDVYPGGRLNFQPEVRTIEPVARKEEVVVEDDDDSESITHTLTPKDPTPPVAKPTPRRHKRPQREFKVDFKRMDSHSELHLFLPQIHDGSRGATPDTPTRQHIVACELPRIEDTYERKSPDDGKSKKKQHKRKKKPLTNIKVKGDDVQEKEFRDRLNDVPTLISLEKEKDHHPASMCVFDNCLYHQHRKSTKLRQA